MVISTDDKSESPFVPRLFTVGMKNGKTRDSFHVSLANRPAPTLPS